MHPDLAILLGQIDEIRDLARQILNGKSNDQANFKPGPKKWSIAEHAAHLVKLGNEYLPVIDEMIESGKARGLYSDDRIRYGLLGRFWIQTMEPPVRMKLPTPRSFKSLGYFDSRSVLNDLLEMQDALGARIARADGLDLRRIHGHSPITRLMRMSLGEWFAFLLAHERRHLWIMARIAEREGFPNEPLEAAWSSAGEKAERSAKTP